MPWLAPAYPAYAPDAHPYLRIRPLAPGEAGPIQAVFAGMSARGRWLRYHTPLMALRPAMLRELTDLGAGRHVALVATLGGRPVGIARWVRDGHPSARQAEVAVEVVDRLQRAGIGAALLRAAARSALGAGVETFVAHILEDNASGRAWAMALGATPDPADPDIVRAAVRALAQLPGSTPSAA